ncbi:MAG: acetylxylan esterase [Verrucomicrobiales bacterium]|nr:acetylxylan esterase [Verrucomicrobiales bacterium]
MDPRGPNHTAIPSARSRPTSWPVTVLAASAAAGALAFALLAPSPARAASVGDAALDRYFATETQRIAARAFAGLDSLEAWQQRRASLRHQLFEMLGLWPLPQRTDLQATVTGTLEQDDITVEKLHFQSLPGLYVTANLYRPKSQSGPLPAILYVCGHAQVKTNGLSCGNKSFYQHHGIWFARHGYVCLLIDTLQLGEIEGDHHGTYRLGQWWWNSRGYTPAGVEAWNSIRALDYLESRPEVDRQRLGMTGRSGGGSYTWTTAALDDRVKVAAPVAGITDLQNQVVDGVIEGHCDCMFFVNTHRWDFGLNAALLAPRPLLIVNTDSDSIFPLSGVQRLHEQVRKIYQLHNATTNLGLVIAPGPHQDTQDLQVPVFRWFNQFLKNDASLIEDAAVKRFSPLDLRVFKELPADQRNTRAQEWFGSSPTAPAANTSLPELQSILRTRVFAGWPDTEVPPQAQMLKDHRENGRHHQLWTFESQPNVPLRLHVVATNPRRASSWVLHLADESTPANWEAQPPAKWRFTAEDREHPGSANTVLETRGLGSLAWTQDARRQIQIRRRFQLLGQTVDGMRVWDIRQAVRMLHQRQPQLQSVEIHASGAMAVNALHAALWEPAISKLVLDNLPTRLEEAPDYLNVAQCIDVPTLLDRVRQRGAVVESR